MKLKDKLKEVKVQNCLLSVGIQYDSNFIELSIDEFDFYNNKFEPLLENNTLKLIDNELLEREVKKIKNFEENTYCELILK